MQSFSREVRGSRSRRGAGAWCAAAPGSAEAAWTSMACQLGPTPYAGGPFAGGVAAPREETKERRFLKKKSENFAGEKNLFVEPFRRHQDLLYVGGPKDTRRRTSILAINSLFFGCSVMIMLYVYTKRGRIPRSHPEKRSLGVNVRRTGFGRPVTHTQLRRCHMPRTPACAPENRAVQSYQLKFLPLFRSLLV